MGVHREGLAASKAHGRFIEGARAALRRMARSVTAAESTNSTGTTTSTSTSEQKIKQKWGVSNKPFHGKMLQEAWGP
jgi:hypothetical protein